MTLTIDADFVDSGDYTQGDHRITIAKYVRTAADTGKFQTSGDVDVTIGPGGSNTSVIVGMVAIIGGAAYTIMAIAGDNKTVTLSGDPSSANCTAIGGLVISGANLTVNSHISWNGTNNASTTDAMPVQSADGYATASEYYGTYYPWKAADNDATGESRWYVAASPPYWWRFDFGAGNEKIINKWRWHGRSDGGANVPVRFKLQGSNDGSNYTDLDTTWASSNFSNPGDAWTTWFTFTNSTAYRYYRVYVTVSSTNTDCSLQEVELVASSGSLLIPSGLYVARTVEDHTRINCLGWTEWNSVAATSSVPGSSKGLVAVNFDGSDSYYIYSSGQRQITRDNSGTKQYRGADDSWIDASINDIDHALEQAMAIAQNQMTWAAFAALTQENLVTLGWTPGCIIDLAVGLQASGSDLPTIDKFTFTYTPGASAGYALSGPGWCSVASAFGG